MIGFPFTPTGARIQLRRHSRLFCPRLKVPSSARVFCLIPRNSFVATQESNNLICPIHSVPSGVRNRALPGVNPPRIRRGSGTP